MTNQVARVAALYDIHGNLPALDRFQGPVLASHSNCRALVPGDRQLDDGGLLTCLRPCDEHGAQQGQGAKHDDLSHY